MTALLSYELMSDEYASLHFQMGVSILLKGFRHFK